MARAPMPPTLGSMNAEIFMWLALEGFALAGVVLLAWTLVHLAPREESEDVPPHLRRPRLDR